MLFGKYNEDFDVDVKRKKQHFNLKKLFWVLFSKINLKKIDIERWDVLKTFVDPCL